LHAVWSRSLRPTSQQKERSPHRADGAIASFPLRGMLPQVQERAGRRAPGPPSEVSAGCLFATATAGYNDLIL